MMKKNASKLLNENSIPKISIKQGTKSVLALFKPYKALLILSIFLSVLGVGASLISPSIVEKIANIIEASVVQSTEIDISLVVDLGVKLLIVIVAGALLSYFEGFFMASVTEKITKRIRSDISRKINKVPLKYLDKAQYGDLMSRITNDADLIGNVLDDNLVSFVSSIVLFVGVLVVMFVTNWILALTGVAATLLGFSIVFIIIKRSQKYFNLQQESIGKMNGHIEETFSGELVVQAYNAEPQTKKTFSKINSEIYINGWKSQFCSSLMDPLMGFVSNLGYVAICIIGSILIINNKIEFGVLIAFIMYLQLFSQPLNSIAESLAAFQSVFAANRRVDEFLNESEVEDENYKIKKLENVKGDVLFDHIKFGYAPNKIIIKDFSADIKAGQKVAIVGPTGAGKTTIVNLLMRFYELNEGQILVDGVSLADLTRENVHELFGMVLQDTWLFNDTIFQNLKYNNSKLSDEKIIEVCKKVEIDHFINTLPKGYNTILDDNTTISSGQKQLLTIARAMLQDKPMYILDEATSSVDTRTEVLIQAAMDKLTAERTSFVIAHRLSTIKNADLILVMNNGDVVEQGKHEQLMRKKGFYYELYNSQFEPEEGAEA